MAKSSWKKIIRKKLEGKNVEQKGPELVNEESNKLKRNLKANAF
jgi:hypothetical protein